MRRWWQRSRPSRQELIQRKHQLAGEIRALGAEVERRRAQGEEVGDKERRLASLRHLHHQTRLEIDRTGPA